MSSLLEAFASDHDTAPIINDTHVAEITDPKLLTVDDAFRAFFTTSPSWLKAVMRGRNKIVGWFGFDTGDGGPAEIPARPVVGDRVGAFSVIDRTNDEILIGSDDAHMDFRISLQVHGRRLTIATTAFAND